MTFMDRRTSNLIGRCITDLVENNVLVEFIPEISVDCLGLDTSGYFDSTIPCLKLATRQKNNSWVELFLHEYCHFCQWRDKMPEVMVDIENLDDWYSDGCAYDYETAEELTRLYQKVELDCEKRVVKLIKKYRLPIDVKRYIRGANAYILLYQVALEEHKWMTAGAYTKPKIREFVPDTFIKDLAEVPEKFRAYARRWCF